MARDKKPGVSFNGKIAEREYKALVKCAAETGLTKTAVVERAIRYYVMTHLKDGMTLDDYIGSSVSDYNFTMGERGDVSV
jgi:hypothetical protein